MSKKYKPNPLQFPEIVGVKAFPYRVTRDAGVQGVALAHAPVLKLVERQAKLDMVNETVEWITEEKLAVSMPHVVLHVLN